jgi:hypothetical protein
MMYTRSTRGSGPATHKARKIVPAFTMEVWEDCAAKDEYYTVLMALEKVSEYRVPKMTSTNDKSSGGSVEDSRKSTRDSADDLVEVKLAAGNLHGIETFPALEEL